jgi:hypothetical protein
MRKYEEGGWVVFILFVPSNLYLIVSNIDDYRQVFE